MKVYNYGKAKIIIWQKCMTTEFVTVKEPK